MIRFSALCSACALLAVAPFALSAGDVWNMVDHVPYENVIIQSHRGAGVLAEENTVHAFEVGWKLGTYPESDLRTTIDGVIVTFHDDNFSRVVKAIPPGYEKKGVKDITYDELLKLDVGAWKGEEFVGRKISKLSDAFAAMKGRPERHLYLDIKNVDFPQLASEVQAAGVDKQIVLASSKAEEIRAWKALVPASDTLLWMRGSEKQLRHRIAELEKTDFAGITQLQIHIFPNKSIEDALAIAGISASRIEVSIPKAKESSEPFTLSNAFIVELGEKLRAHHILFQALPYTEDASIYAVLADLGLMSFATDHPDIAKRELKSYYERKGSTPKS